MVVSTGFFRDGVSSIATVRYAWGALSWAVHESVDPALARHVWVRDRNMQRIRLHFS